MDVGQDLSVVRGGRGGGHVRDHVRFVGSMGLGEVGEESLPSGGLPPACVADCRVVGETIVRDEGGSPPPSAVRQRMRFAALRQWLCTGICRRAWRRGPYARPAPRSRRCSSIRTAFRPRDPRSSEREPAHRNGDEGTTDTSTTTSICRTAPSTPVDHAVARETPEIPDRVKWESRRRFRRSGRTRRP